MEYKPVFKMLLGSHLPLLPCLKTPLCKRASRGEIDPPSRHVGRLGWGPVPAKRAVPRMSFPLMGSPKDGLEMYALQEVLGPLMYGYVWLFVLCFDVFMYIYIFYFKYIYPCIYISCVGCVMQPAVSQCFLDTVCLHVAYDVD